MGASFYWVLFGSQAVGAGMILWKGVPIYRRLLANDDPTPLSEVLPWALIAIALIQAGYWTSRRYFPALSTRRRVFLGHVIPFVGRLGFTYVGGMFSAVFYTRYQDVEFSMAKFAVLFAVLFSMFCWLQEFDRCGKALCEGSPHRAP